MKYWSYLVGKVVVATGVLLGLWNLIVLFAPVPDTFMFVRPKNPIGQDLTFTFLGYLWWLAAFGMGWAIVWDQRYRCRTCLRRLRMPIHKGSWTHILFNAPRTEYICLYGHGTLKVDELQLTGHHYPDWEPNEDMWKELFSLEETKK